MNLIRYCDRKKSRIGNAVRDMGFRTVGNVDILAGEAYLEFRAQEWFRKMEQLIPIQMPRRYHFDRTGEGSPLFS